MLTMQDEARVQEQRSRESATVEDAIARDVLCRLGCPDGLHRVQVKPVSGDKYRVNVYVRADFASYRVAHSYFLEADGDGRVLASSPAITRTYDPCLA